MISNVSNVDFLLSINEQKFAVLFDFLENTGWFLITLAGVCWLIVKLLHREQIKARPSPTWALAASIALMTFMFGVLIAVKSTGAVPSVITQWTLQNGQCVAMVDTSKMEGFRKNYKLALACGITDPLRDRIEDEAISVSGPYTIVPGGVPITVPTRPAMAALLKPAIQQQIWFDAIILPNDISTDKVTRLSDVSKLGGKILRPGFFN